MGVYGIGADGYRTLPGYGLGRTQGSAEGNQFAGQMGNVQKSQMAGGAFELHYFDNEDGERAVSAACGTDYSVTVYEPKGFDAANPVYKVKIWDKEGNTTERMVDISQVDPKNSDFIDMYAYSSYLEKSGKCPDALSSFMGSGTACYGTGERTYDDLSRKINWPDAVREMMMMQYDAGNLQGYLGYKRFLDTLMEM